MNKIEPMTTAGIADLIRIAHNSPGLSIVLKLEESMGLALAYVEAEARAKHAYHHWNAALKVDHSEHFPCTTCDMKYEDWLAVVKREVGWVEDQNNA